jgi:hypothetical protein
MLSSSRHAMGDLEKAPPPDGSTRLAQALATILCTATVCGLLGVGLAWLDIHLARRDGILGFGDVAVVVEITLGAFVGFAAGVVLGTAWVIGRRLLKRRTALPETTGRRSA